MGVLAIMGSGPRPASVAQWWRPQQRKGKRGVLTRRSDTATAEPLETSGNRKELCVRMGAPRAGARGGVGLLEREGRAVVDIGGVVEIEQRGATDREETLGPLAPFPSLEQTPLHSSR